VSRDNDLFLVTTADESTWPSEGSAILFLGEWCRLYKRKEVWEKLDAELVPYHWDDRNKLNEDYLYLSKLHETLLIELSQKLNEIHAVNYSERYWRILVGPWLGYFTQILFDRWSSIKQVLSQYDFSATLIFQGHEEDLVPNDMNSFMEFFQDDSWNHYIYSLFLKNSSGLNCIKKERKSTHAGSLDLSNPSAREVIKIKFRNFISGILKLFQKNNDAFLINTYLSIEDGLKLNFRLSQFPQLRERCLPENIKTDLNQRKWVLPGKNNLEFESCLRTIIPQQLPKIYLEGYSTLIIQTELMNWPQRPKFIFTSNNHYFDDIFKAWTAHKVEMGSPLLIGQHGGYYGIGKWSFTEEHEIAISDAFLSWGWSDENKPKVKPVGILKKMLPLNINHGIQPHLLLVNNINPIQSYHLYSCTISRQWLDYLNDQFRFVNSLTETLRNALIVRLHPQDLRWAPYCRWKDQFPAIQIDQGNADIMASIRISRIYVSTYNATTFLESLAMDVPTVIFWNPVHWELRNSAIPYFEELKRIGVFHETPESAAVHIDRVWNDVNVWWYRKDVREVLSCFKKTYCNIPMSLTQEIEETLKGFYRSKKNV